MIKIKDKVKNMTKKKVLMPALLITAMAASLTMTGCGSKKAETSASSIPAVEVSEASDVVYVSDVNALQPAAVEGLDIDTAISNSLKLFAGASEQVYIGSDGSLACNTDSNAADLAKSLAEQGVTISQAYGGYYLGSDGYLRNSAGDIYFEDSPITYFTVNQTSANSDGSADSQDSGDLLEKIYAVTANGQILYCNANNALDTSSAMYGVRYVSAIDNAYILGTLQDGSCVVADVRSITDPENDDLPEVDMSQYEGYVDDSGEESADPADYGYDPDVSQSSMDAVEEAWNEKAASFDFSGIQVADWTNVKWAVLGKLDTSLGIASAGGTDSPYYAVALTADGKVLGTGNYPTDVDNWSDIIYINTLGENGLYGLKADGSVLVAGVDTYGIASYEGLSALDARTGSESNIGIVDDTNGYGKVDALMKKFDPATGEVKEEAAFTQLVPDGGYQNQTPMEESDELELADQ